jgi:dTMP kinase
LDIDFEIAARRLNRQLDRMEQKGADYHKKVREGFIQLARSRKDFVVIHAADDIETVHKKILEVIKAAGFK